MRVLFLNPQGNFDANDSYWTEHPDFGGQLVYVKEIAIEMAKQGHQVDIITRYLEDPEFPAIQGTLDAYEGADNVRIVRVPCSPNNVFLRKELLWEHIEEWVDNIIALYDKENLSIDFATGHYGDGGLACAFLKAKRNIPYSFTGHSLGAQKFEKLYNGENFKELDIHYFFTKRILAERTAIQYSDIVFVSTKQERDEQYSHVLYKDVSTSASFHVVPPGANTTVFHALSDSTLTPKMKELELSLMRDIAAEHKDKSYIIAASRLDTKKNHLGLLKAYAQSKELQEKSNMVISVRGIPNVFEDYSSTSEKEQQILKSLLDIVEEYKLYGQVSFLDIRTQHELAETYRMLSTKKGVFCLTALYEPFGLAPIEAMSTGLPAVVTMYGGPFDVLKENGEKYGVLVDVNDTSKIAEGLLDCINNYDFFKKQGMHRVYSTYTWSISAKRYLEAIQSTQLSKTNIDIPRYFITKDLKDLDNQYILHTTKS